MIYFAVSIFRKSQMRPEVPVKHTVMFCTQLGMKACTVSQEDWPNIEQTKKDAGKSK